MSSPATGGPANGHLSPDDAMDSTLVTRSRQSDEALSGAQGDSEPTRFASPLNAPNGSTSHVRLDDNDAMSESQSSSDDNMSEDADFDMQQSSPSNHDMHSELEVPDDLAPTPTRASSSDSVRPVKRKAHVEEDEYIKANPELYGLRRSVCP